MSAVCGKGCTEYECSVQYRMYIEYECSVQYRMHMSAEYECSACAVQDVHRI